jgi:hypothetical protein
MMMHTVLIPNFAALIPYNHHFFQLSHIHLMDFPIALSDDN